MKYFVVVTGSYDKKTYRTDYEMCVGIFKTANEAYGKAYLDLSEKIRDVEGKATGTVSAPYELEADAGFGMRIIDDTLNYQDYAFVLFYEEDE